MNLENRYHNISFYLSVCLTYCYIQHSDDYQMFVPPIVCKNFQWNQFGEKTSASHPSPSIAILRMVRAELFCPSPWATHTQILLQKFICGCFAFEWLMTPNSSGAILKSDDGEIKQVFLTNQTKCNIVKRHRPKKTSFFCCHVTMLQPWTYAEKCMRITCKKKTIILFEMVSNMFVQIFVIEAVKQNTVV